MGFDILKKQEFELVKKRALCADFSKIDSMLIERHVPVRLIQAGPYPAWSDGNQITFVANQMDLDTVEDIIAANGLNYHELSHLLYTPRTNHPLQSWVQQKTVRRPVFNMLEDSRIERILTNKYGATKPYFLNTVIKYILNTEEMFTMTDKDRAMLHLLCHARRYIPADIRQEFRRRFRKEFGRHQEKMVTDTIDEYVRCNPDNTNQMVTMQECITRIVNFLHKNGNPPLPDKDHNGDEHSPSHIPHEQRRRTADKVKKDIDNANSQESEDEDGSGGGQDQESDSDDDSDGQGSSGSGLSDDENSEDQEDGSGTGGDGDAADGSETGGQDGSDDSTEESGGQSAGKGAGRLSPGNLKDRLQETLEGIKSNPEVARDVANTQRLLREGKNAGRSERIQKIRSYLVKPDEVYTLASKRLAREFGKIVEDSDPGMKTYQSSGKVNMKRAMMQSDPDTVFDFWDEGQVDSADFELVLMVDRSGSMAKQQNLANQAAWAILRGVDSLGGRAKTTYLAFETESHMVKTRDQSVGPEYWNFSSAGGTNPQHALQEAMTIFHTSDKSRGVLICLTDGAWDSPAGCDKMVERLNAAGIVTALAGMYQHNYDYGKHSMSVFQRIDSPDELIPFAKEIVKQVMKTTIRR